MGRDREGLRPRIGVRLPRETLAPLLVAALLLATGVANLWWDLGVPSSSSPARLSPSADPFPVLPAAPILHVLPVPWTTNASAELTLTSLQGLVNRNGAQLYLDVDNETGNASSMLTFLASRYGVTYDVVDLAWVYAHYLSSVRGIIVTDPARPESVNIGTMLASPDDAVLADPPMAAYLHAAYGLPVLLDYASSNWTATDAAGAYDRALRDLYPSCDPDLLAILPPDQLALRDYLIATRTFVFYEPQGMLATPEQIASTQRILAVTPRGIPILGWFPSPTLTEENAFIQLASRYGKSVFGSEGVPNLSVLTAYGRNEVRSQPAPPAAPPLQNKTYAVVAVPDGDNLDFTSGRMRTLWAEPERGTFPIAWSLSPLLADLAPPYLDYYYRTATPDDRFVMGPSGAGYVYPDYFGSGDLSAYLQTTSRYENETGMDVFWLLNAFVASEIPYRPSTLSAYVSALHPRGLVLDYDDQAKTQDVWMQAGGTAAAPVIRSTQMWSTTDNFDVKVGDAMASWGPGAHFLWITVYTFRFDLADAAAMVRGLEARTGGNVVVVTPEQLFTLVQEDFQLRAGQQLAAMRADPFAAALFAPQLRDAQARLDGTAAADSPASPAYLAYQAITDLRDAGFEEALVVSGIAVVLAALVQLRRVGGGTARARAVAADARPLVVLAAAFGLFLLAMRSGLEANFWSYQWIVVGVVFAGAGRPLRRYLDRTYPRVSLPVTAGLDLAFVALSLATNVAFSLAAIGTVALADAVLSREPSRPAGLVLALSLGTAAGFLLPIDALSFGLLGILLLAPLATAPVRPATPEPAPAKGALLRGLVVTLPVAVLVAASNYSLTLRLGLSGDQLPELAAAILVLGPLAGLLAVRGRGAARSGNVVVAALALAAVLAASLLLVSGTVATALVLLFLAASLAVAAEATLRRVRARGESVPAVLTTAVSWIPLFLLFFRMPPVVYSLSLVPLPAVLEAALYAPVSLLAAGFAAIALVAALRLRRAASVAKGYPPTATLQGGRSL